MRFVVFSGLLFICGLAQAATLLVDNGTNTTQTGNKCTTCGDTPTQQWRVFDDLTLTTDSQLQQLVFEAGTVTQSDITISIWTDLVAWSGPSGFVHTATYSFSDLAPVQNTFVGGTTYDNYTLTADLSNWNLAAGTYWIGFYGKSLAMPLNGVPVYGSKAKQMNLYDGRIITAGDGVSFRAYGSAVPIPAAAWLFGSALAGLGWIKRKQAA
ncbi:VPLPA-CTERM sorting domain-containing protein [Gammaproteobacteria bacterium]|nr:VPLPA-CTERM sorting domain-containing protein [Gammaproteobacteria bacterium]